MRHVPDGTLRRLADEPFAVPDGAASHLESCVRCRDRLEQVKNDVLVSDLLLSELVVGDAEAAWREFRTAEPIGVPASLGRVRQRRWHLLGASMSTGVSIAMVGLVVAGVAAAATLTTVFAPTKVAPVSVTTSDLATLGSALGLDNAVASGRGGGAHEEAFSFGKVQWSAGRGPTKVATLAAAEASSGLAVRLPRSLPGGVGAVADYAVLRTVTATVTFASSAGPKLSGSTLTVSAGPGIDVNYANATSVAGNIDALGIVWARRPVATSSGATATDLENFLLSRPGIPGDLRQELRLVGNLSTTLPVPTPAGADSETTTIDGAPAVVLADGANVASGAIWEDHAGIVHVAIGLLDKSDLLNVARQIG